MLYPREMPGREPIDTTLLQGRLRDLNRYAESAELDFRVRNAREADAEFRYRSIGYPALRFECWKQSGAAVLEEPPQPDRYHLVVPERGAGTLQTEGETYAIAAGESAAILSPWRAHTFEHGAGWQDRSVVLDRAELERQYAAITGNEKRARIEFPVRIDLRSPAGGRLSRLVDFMVRESLRPNGLMHAPHSRGPLIDTLIATLCTLSYGPNLSGSERDRGIRIVRQAEEYMAAHLDQPLRVPFVAARLGVSVRSLQGAFRRARGHGPLAFLRNRRLAMARTLLRTPDGPSVTSIALQCGFSHASHFGAAYLERYGETPSRTRAAGLRKFDSPPRECP